jgi:hypothetical protein
LLQLQQCQQQVGASAAAKKPGTVLQPSPFFSSSSSSSSSSSQEGRAQQLSQLQEFSLRPAETEVQRRQSQQLRLLKRRQRRQELEQEQQLLQQELQSAPKQPAPVCQQRAAELWAAAAEAEEQQLQQEARLQQLQALQAQKQDLLQLLQLQQKQQQMLLLLPAEGLVGSEPAELAAEPFSLLHSEQLPEPQLLAASAAPEPAPPPPARASLSARHIVLLEGPAEVCPLVAAPVDSAAPSEIVPAAGVMPGSASERLAEPATAAVAAAGLPHLYFNENIYAESL